VTGSTLLSLLHATTPPWNIYMASSSALNKYSHTDLTLLANLVVESLPTAAILSNYLFKELLIAKDNDVEL